MKRIKDLDIKYKFAAILVLCLSIVGMLVRLILFPEIPLYTEIRVFLFSLVVFSFFITIFFVINNTLNRYLPYDRSVPMRIIIQIVIGLIFLIILRTLLLKYALPHAPIEIKLNKIFVASIYMVDFLACLSINLAFFSEYFFKQWKLTIQKTERLEKEKALVQYDNLKNKLNPHFLFNALTSLNTLIYENQEQASQFLKQLSKVYRYLLQNNDIISLGKELEFVENYVSLLKTRFGKALKIEIKIDEREKQNRIVPITIQSLIENALKHNIIIEENPLEIKIYIQGEYLCTENNLQKKTIVESSNKQGLKNLKNLYHYLSPKEIEIEESQKKFLVKVPLLSNE